MRKITFKKLATTFVLVACCLLISQTVQARTCRVGAARSYTTIASALAVSSCSPILVDAGTYYENLTIDRDVQIIGAGRDATIIDGSSVDSVISVNVDDGSIVSISKLTIQNGASSTSGLGGGIYSRNGDLTLVDVIVRNNTAPGSGGGIFTGSSLFARNCLFVDNVGIGGGAISIGQNLTVIASRFLNNESSTGGGAILAGTENAYVVVRGSTFINNTAAGFGGAILGYWGDGMVQISDSLFNHNTAGSGSAIYSYTNMSIENSTVSENVISALSGGGAIQQSCLHAGLDSLATLNNVTIFDNASLEASMPANGIEVADSAYDECSATIEVSNTIIADSDNQNCAETGGYGTITSLGNNLDSDGTCAFAEDGDISGVSADLGVLAYNGGPTQTHLPHRTSPVINAGNNDTCATRDQRGVTRPQGATCDIGAVEVVLP